MLIRSLCWFPSPSGRRLSRATQEVRDLLDSQRGALRIICIAATAAQLLPLLLLLLLREHLPSLLDTGGSLQSEERWRATWMLAATVLAVGVARAGARYLALSWAGRCGHRFVAAFRELVYAQLLRLPVGYVERRGAGRLLLRFIGDTDALRSWVSRTGPMLAANLLTGAVIVSAMLSISWRLTAVALAPLLPLSVGVAGLSARLRRLTRQARASQAELTAQVGRDLGDIRAAKVLDAHREARNVLQRQIAMVAEQNTERDRAAACLEGWGQAAIFTTVPLLVLAGSHFNSSGGLSSADWLTLVWLALQLTSLLRGSLGAIAVHQKALVSVQRLHRLLSRTAERGRSGKTTVKLPLRLTLPAASGPDSSRSRPLELEYSQPGSYELPDDMDAEQLFGALLGFNRWPHGTLGLGGRDSERISVQARRREILYLTAPLLGHHGGEHDTDESQGPIAALLQTLQDETGGIDWQASPMDSRADFPGLHEQRIACCQVVLASPRLLLIPARTVRGWSPQIIAWLESHLAATTVILRASSARPWRPRPSCAAPGTIATADLAH